MTIFSKIVAGEIPSYKCAENDKFYAFLDISPLAKGHTLVIPKKEVDYIFDMEDEDSFRCSQSVWLRLSRLLSLARRWRRWCWAWRFRMLIFTSFLCRARLMLTSVRSI